MPNGTVHLKVRYHDLRTEREDEIERIADSLSDCIHEVGQTIRLGSRSGRSPAPLSAIELVELLCRFVNRNRAKLDALKWRG